MAQVPLSGNRIKMTSLEQVLPQHTMNGLGFSSPLPLCLGVCLCGAAYPTTPCKSGRILIHSKFQLGQLISETWIFVYSF